MTLFNNWVNQYLDIVEFIGRVLSPHGQVMMINKKDYPLLDYKKEEIEGRM
jgi:hypothetical protein